MKMKKILLALVLTFFAVITSACSLFNKPDFSVNDTFVLNDNGEYVATVSGSVTEMDVISKFEVAEGYTLNLYADEAYTSPIRGKVQLYIGENTFYLLVLKGDEKVEDYVVRITRNQEYKVTFKDDGKIVKEVYVGAGEKIPAEDIPDLKKDGYDFDGWTTSIDSVVTENFTTSAKWKVKTDTAYTVCHYQQTTAGQNDYQLIDTENLAGTTQETATAVQKNYAGYRFNVSQSVVSGIIAGDGSLTLNMYYDIITVDYMVKVFEENRDDNDFVELVGKRKSLVGNLTSTVSYVPETVTGFVVNENESELSVTLGENVNENVIKVYYSRIRTTVSFGTGNEQRTAKYGFGLVTADGLADTAPNFTQTPSAGEECYWAIENTTNEINFRTLTENVSVEEKLKVKTNTIFFDLDLSLDTERDGVEYEIGEETTREYADGEKVSFNVLVNKNYSQSIVKYYFRNGSVATEIFPIDVSNDGVQVYEFTPSDDGVVYATGEYVENEYDVKFTLELFDPEWGTIRSINEIKYTVDGKEYNVTSAGEITLKLKKGTHEIKIIEPNGKEKLYTAVISPNTWEETLSFSIDFGKYVAGYSRILSSSASDTVINDDGTIKTNKDKTVYFNLTDCDTSGDFALKMRYTLGSMTDMDPKFGFQIRVGAYRLLNVFVKHTHLVIQGGFSGDVGTVAIEHGISAFATHTNDNPLVFELMLIKTSESLRLYYNVIEANDNGEFALLATVTSTQITVGETTTQNDDKITATVNGLLTETLGGAPVSIVVNILVSAQGERYVTYSHYGVKKENLTNE